MKSEIRTISIILLMLASLFLIGVVCSGVMGMYQDGVYLRDPPTHDLGYVPEPWGEPTWDGLIATSFLIGCSLVVLGVNILLLFRLINRNIRKKKSFLCYTFGFISCFLLVVVSGFSSTGMFLLGFDDAGFVLFDFIPYLTLLTAIMLGVSVCVFIYESILDFKSRT